MSNLPTCEKSKKKIIKKATLKNKLRQKQISLSENDLYL